MNKIIKVEKPQIGDVVNHRDNKNPQTISKIYNNGAVGIEDSSDFYLREQLSPGQGHGQWKANCGDEVDRGANTDGCCVRRKPQRK
jgi:hypothetical protein